MIIDLDSRGNVIMTLTREHPSWPWPWPDPLPPARQRRNRSCSGDVDRAQSHLAHTYSDQAIYDGLYVWNKCT